jgi:CheY-like chemotaxis protein
LAPAAPRRDGRLLLIVEDDPTFAELLGKVGRELEFDCISAAGADAGFQLAISRNPSAIVLDIGLPDHSGLSVLDRLKRNPKTRHIPVHVVSGHDHAQTALDMGAVGYAIKPIKYEELVEALRRLSAKAEHKVRRVLVVEDDKRQRESVCLLLTSAEVETIPVATAAEALTYLQSTPVDCVVMDLRLPDGSAHDILETLAAEARFALPPVIIHTGQELSRQEEDRLRRHSKSIIIKGARSPERLLDEVTLFLHQVESELPPDRQRMLVKARDREALLSDRVILIVEDDVRNIFALTSVLEPRGVKVEIARTGREALSQLENLKKVDLVLMDIMMPEMDGFEAMRRIRAQPKWEKLPIIALTAKVMRDDHERCLKAGANDYVAKPIEVDKLLSLIRVWMPK